MRIAKNSEYGAYYRLKHRSRLTELQLGAAKRHFHIIVQIGAFAALFVSVMMD
jgi:hypothetical protein